MSIPSSIPHLQMIGLAGRKGAGKNTVAQFLRGYGFVEIALADPIKRFCTQVFDVSRAECWAPSERKDRTVVTHVAESLRDHRNVASAIQHVFPFAPATVGLRLEQVLAPWTAEGAPPPTLRTLMQKIGTEWGKGLDPYVWIRILHETCARLAQGGVEYNPFVGLIPDPPTFNPTPAASPDHPLRVVVSDIRFPSDEGASLRLWGAEVWWLDCTGRIPEPAQTEHSSEPRTQDFEFVRTAVLDRNGADPEDWKPTLALLRDRFGFSGEGAPKYTPLPAIPVFFQGGRIPCAWACPLCGAVGTDLIRWHCQPQPCEGWKRVCGAVPQKHHILCVACERARDADKAAERVRQATPIRAEDYTDPVWWEGSTEHTMNGDGYFESVDALLAHCADHDLTPPPYVYACHPSTPHSDVSWVIDSALEEFYEEARDRIDPAAERELQATLDAFWTETGIRGWNPDFSRVIHLPHPHPDHVVPTEEAPTPDASPDSA